jgi:geranylgeranyl diphosphate synthase type II
LDVAAYLHERSALVDRHIDASLPPSHEPPCDLHRAMRHLIFPGGKRLRPAFAFAAAEAVGAPPERAVPAAVALELVHSYSLVHDDLPCMDDDSVRRGRPTVHVAFDEATAVLAGDALLAAAFEALAAGVQTAPPEAVLACVRDLAVAAGSRHLVGGQADDLAFDPELRDATRVESVHRRKTGALFEAAVACGARLAGAREDQLVRLRRFGVSIGLGFQIADDLLDAGRADLCSLVRALGPRAARERAQALLGEALAEIEGFGQPAEPLRDLARFAIRRDE